MKILMHFVSLNKKLFGEIKYYQKYELSKIIYLIFKRISYLIWYFLKPSVKHFGSSKNI